MTSSLSDGIFNLFSKELSGPLANGFKIPGITDFGYYGGVKRNKSAGKSKGRTFKQIARIANPRQYSRSNRPFPGQPFYPQGKP